MRAAYAHYIERIGREPAPMAADYTDLIARGLIYVMEPQLRGGIHGVLVLRPDD